MNSYLKYALSLLLGLAPGVFLQAHAKPFSPYEVGVGLYLWPSGYGSLSMSDNGRWVALRTTKGTCFADVATGEISTAKAFVKGANNDYLPLQWSQRGDEMIVKDYREGRTVLNWWKSGEKTVRELVVFPRKMALDLYGGTAWAHDGKAVYLISRLHLAKPKAKPADDLPPNESNNVRLRISGMGDADTERPWSFMTYNAPKVLYPEAYAESNRTIVLAVDVATGGMRLMYEGNDITQIYPSPDGKWMAMVQEKGRMKDQNARDTGQMLADIYLMPIPKMQDMQPVDLEKYDKREIGSMDHTGKRLDPVLKDIQMNGLTSPEGRLSLESPHLQWSPEGAHFAYATTGMKASGDVFVYSLVSKNVSNLTERLELPQQSKGNGFAAASYRRVDGSPKFGNTYPPVWLPDGKGLIGIARGEAWYIPLETQNSPKILTQNLPMETIWVVPDGNRGVALVDSAGAIIVAAKDADSRLDSVFKVNLATTDVQKIADTGVWMGEANIWASSATNTLVYMGQIATSQTEAYKLSLNAPGVPVALTSFKKELAEREWPEKRILHWKTPSGKAASGVLYLPAGADNNKKVPMAMDVEPSGIRQLNGRLLSTLDHEMENGAYWAYWGNRGAGTFVLLKHGIAVFKPDIPMSDEGVYDHPMTEMMEGVNAATDAVLATGVIDESRLAIIGNGNGGYLVQVVATQSNRFKTGVSIEGWSNLTSLYGVRSPEWVDINGDPWRYFENGRGRMGKALWEDPLRYIESSPIRYMDKVDMSLLLVSSKWGSMSHSTDRYYNLNAQTFGALQRFGRRVVLGNRTTMNDDEKYRLVLWLDEHLLGAEPRAQIAELPSFFFGGDMVPSDVASASGASAAKK